MDGIVRIAGGLATGLDRRASWLRQHLHRLQHHMHCRRHADLSPAAEASVKSFLSVLSLRRCNKHARIENFATTLSPPAGIHLVSGPVKSEPENDGCCDAYA
jgi:hypothetical protein